MGLNLDKTKITKLLICQCKALKNSIERSLGDANTRASGRYASFATYAGQYNNLASDVCRVLELPRECFANYDTENMPSWGDSLWPHQRQIMESVLLGTDMLLSYLEADSEFSDDVFSDLENYIKTRLRPVVFTKPAKEVEIQNAIENLFVGRGWNKGIDYDRETGKVLFSGKEYIPDFIIPKLRLCIEVKLVREGKKSSIIEQINSDITGYGKKYERQLYIVYDLGEIRDEVEFKRDIENTGDRIRVVIVKH